MGQGEVLELLKEHPRLTTREIAEILDCKTKRISSLLHRLIKGNEVIGFKPTKEELERILNKFPKSIYGVWQLKVFEVNDK